MGIGRFVYTPILPFMKEGLGLSAEEAGLIASANFAGYLAGALLGAFSTLPGSQRAWFLGGLLASAATAALMAGTSDFWAFLAIRFLSGGASAFVLVFSSALILDRLRDAGRAGLSALHFAGVGCGIAFSALFVAGLGAAGSDWRGLWLASAAATLVLLVASNWLVGAPVQKPETAGVARKAGNSREGRLSRPLLRLVFAYGLFGFGYVITATFVSTIARTTPELHRTEAYVWLAVGLCAAPSVYVWNRIASAIGARRAFALACLFEALGVAVTVIGTNPALFLLGASVLGGTFMGITALGLVEAQRLTASAGPASRRRILAVMTASFGLGQVLGPWFAGELHAVTGSFQAPSLVAAAALIAASALAVR